MSKNINYISTFIIGTIAGILLPTLLFQQETTLPLPFKNIGQFTPALSSYQDSTGFIWLGTYEGLVRYDGTSNHIFRHNPNDSTSLAGNIVISIAPGRNHDLWLGVPGHGIDHFDLKTRKFIHIDNELEDAGVSHRIASLFLDSSNNLWIGTQDATIAYYDLTTQKVRVIDQTPEIYRENNLPMRIADFAEDQDGNIWMAQFTTLTKYIRDIDSLIFVTPPFKTPYVNNIEIDHRSGIIYVGDDVNGIFQYDPDLNKWASLDETFSQFTEYKDSSLRQILLQDNQELWAANGRGISKFDLKNNLYHFYPLKDEMGDLIIEQKGNVFLFGSNVYQLVPPIKGINYLIPPDSQVDWFNGFIKYQDKYLVNTCLFDGFKVIDLKSEHLTDIENLFPELQNLSPKIIYEDRNLNWWIADYFSSRNNNPHQLYKFNTSTRRLTAIEGKRWSTVSSIVEDKNGTIWVGSWKGLVKIHPEKGIESYYAHNPEEPQGLGSNSIRKLFIDSKDKIWIATSGGGLNKFDPVTGSFKHWKYNRSDTSSLSNNQVWDIHEDKKGRIWVATANGLNLLDPNKNTFERFFIEEGTPYQIINSIEEDYHGFLWLSNASVIMRFDPATNEFLTYSQPGSIYSWKDHTGKIYFGRKYFHPDSMEFKQPFPTLNFTDFNIPYNHIRNNGESMLNSDINYTQTITLNHTVKVFTINYSGWYFEDPSVLKYKYQLDGYDETWFTTDKSQLTLTSLPHGNYRLRMKTGNDMLGWGKEKILAINILPPWWKTSWAYIFYLLSAVLFIYKLYQWKKSQWKIKTRLEIEHAKSERFKELNEFKSRFYTNISHEFRTPLTVITGMADQIIMQPEQWFLEGSKLIKRNAHNLLRLVNDLLNLSKLEAGMILPEMIQDDIILYLKYLLESFYSLANTKSIKLQFSSSLESLMMDFDPEKIREIISNLLTNSIKHTSEGGEISVSVKCKNHNNQKTLEIGITDSGIGMNQDELPYIFDRYYSGKTQKSGHGIGLALTKELVHLLNGHISVESKPGEGTRFKVLIPVTNLTPLPTIKDYLSEEVSTDHASKKEVNYKRKMFSDKKEDLPTILIVDDNVDVVTYMRVCLDKMYHVEVAYNGMEGWKKGLEIVPDIIISDVMMPEMSGYEMCFELKQDFRTSHIPIILLTAKADVDSRIQGIKEGADAYLSKPFIKDELLIRIEKLLELRKQLQNRYRVTLPIDTKDARYQLEDDFMALINQLLIQHIGDENFGIQEICIKMNVSKTQLYRKFSALTNKPIGQYIKEVRLEKARDLLLHSHKNITEISMDVGFKDVAYFSRVFKDHEGIPPSKYRTIREK